MRNERKQTFKVQIIQCGGHVWGSAVRMADRKQSILINTCAKAIATHCYIQKKKIKIKIKIKKGRKEILEETRLLMKMMSMIGVQKMIEMAMFSVELYLHLFVLLLRGEITKRKRCILF
jgi:hypothetical protein